MTDHLCVCCPVLRPADAPRIPDDMPVCNGCRRTVRRDVGDLVDAYAGLPDALAPGSSRHERVSGGREEAPIPLRPDVVDLMGPVNEAARALLARGLLGVDPDQSGHLSVATMLHGWVREWRDVRRKGEGWPEPTVTSMTGWLLDRLDWALDEHPAVDEFAAEVREFLRAMRSLTASHHDRESAGRCPALLRDDSRCSARLSVDPYSDVIACGRCGTSWHRRERGWMKLRAQQAEWNNGQGEAA